LYEKISHNQGKLITEEICTVELIITTLQKRQSKSFIKNAKIRGAWV
jgi:hypothetical protein